MYSEQKADEVRRTVAVFGVLGVQVHALQIPDAIHQMEEWISAGTSGHYVAVTGMHGVVEAQHDPSFKQILNFADLVVPDGMPLVWLARWRGFVRERARDAIQRAMRTSTHLAKASMKPFKNFRVLSFVIFPSLSKRVAAPAI